MMESALMDKLHGIIVFGANGSGKTTLGRELARILAFKHIDHEDFGFEESEIPYAKPRSYADSINLLLTYIKKHPSFVLSAVTGDFGDIIPQYYELAVYLSAPIEVRMNRIKQRAVEQHGDRIREGGDMYEQEQRFIEFAASRPLEKIDQWADTLTCPVIRLDGTEDWRRSAEYLAEQYIFFERMKDERHYIS